MESLISINKLGEIPFQYRSNAIGDLFRYHNLDQPFDDYDEAEMLIGMCMDHRKRLDIPQNFAYIMRDGGANLKMSEFKMSFAIAIGGVRCMAIIGHSNCGMVNLQARKADFIKGLVEGAGWAEEQAEAHFESGKSEFGITEETEFVVQEVNRLRKIYPKIAIAPLFYKLEDNRLYLIKEK